MIIVEDGTGSNPLANSYTDIDALESYSVLRLIDLSKQSDEQQEALLIKAMDWLEGQRHRYRGTRIKTSQPLEWPRRINYEENLIGDNYLFDASIPRELRSAQLILSIAAIDNDLQPTLLPGDAGSVIRQRVGPIETAYSAHDKMRKPHFTAAENIMIRLFRPRGAVAVRS